LQYISDDITSLVESYLDIPSGVDVTYQDNSKKRTASVTFYITIVLSNSIANSSLSALENTTFLLEYLEEHGLELEMITGTVSKLTKASSLL
jgi:hypothetical protein